MILVSEVLNGPFVCIRAVVARYFSFLVISQLFVFTLIGVIFSAFFSCPLWFCGLLMSSRIGATLQVIKLIGKHRSFGDILKNLDSAFICLSVVAIALLT